MCARVIHRFQSGKRVERDQKKNGKKDKDKQNTGKRQKDK